MNHEEKPSQEYDLDKDFQHFIGKVVRDKKISRQDITKIRKAFLFAKNAHDGQYRKSGEPYISHPLAVARIVYEEMGLFATGIIGAFLHDVLEDTPVTKEEIENQFGKTVVDIVAGLTKISKIEGNDWGADISYQAQNYRQILMTISDDIRVVIIKIADRLHNMRTLGAQQSYKQLKITSETLYLYAPLAHRLGMNNIKTELEDLSLKYSQPQAYEEISKKLNTSKSDAEAYIERFIRSVKQCLSMTGIKVIRIESRFKSIYSIYNKIQTKGVSFEEIMDLYAIRIIIEDRHQKEIDDCWRVFTTITNLYPSRPDRIRDWLRLPKSNGYQSLHTTVRGLEGKMVEIQIRTEAMDATAKKGLTSHWMYKEEKEILVIDQKLIDFTDRVQEILKNKSSSPEELVSIIKNEIRLDNLNVFTPKGELKTIVQGASVLDFAYLIHSKIGNHAIGAKVNNDLVSLDYTLQQGDQIEIITSSKITVKEEWLKSVITSRAIHAIKEIVRVQRKDKIESGRLVVNRFYKRLGIHENTPEVEELLRFLSLPDLEALYYKVGMHDPEVLSKADDFIKYKQNQTPVPVPGEIPSENSFNTEFLVLGKEVNIENVIIASCCNPVIGDDIVGLQRKNRVVIHRTSCEHAIKWMANHGSDIIKANFSESAEVSFLAALKVQGIDSQGVLIRLLQIISVSMKLNMRKVFIDTKEGQFEGLFLIFIKNAGELNRLIERLRSLPNVKSVTRTDNNFKPFEN